MVSPSLEKLRGAIIADEARALARLARALILAGHHIQHNGHALARPTVHPIVPARLYLSEYTRAVHG
jgi:hypothetical protein